jgi:hypothetical protein
MALLLPMAATAQSPSWGESAASATAAPDTGPVEGALLIPLSSELLLDSLDNASIKEMAVQVNLGLLSRLSPGQPHLLSLPLFDGAVVGAVLERQEVSAGRNFLAVTS